MNKPTQDDFGAAKPSQARAMRDVKKKPEQPAPEANSKIVINPDSNPLPDNATELFATGCLQGMPKYVAYQRFINPNTPKKEAIATASKLFHRPDVTARLLYLRNEAEKSESHPVTNEELRKIMSAIARSGCPNERIAASKQLRDWIKEDTEKADALHPADPALISQSIASYLRAVPSMVTETQAEYVIGLVIASKIPVDVWIDTLIAHRDGAPPPTADPMQDTQPQEVAPIVDNKTPNDSHING